MKRLLTFFLICFSFVEYTRAEDIINYKYWDEGKLTWDDFQDTLSLKGVPSAFNAFLRIEKQKNEMETPARFVPKRKPVSTNVILSPTGKYKTRTYCGCSS